MFLFYNEFKEKKFTIEIVKMDSKRPESLVFFLTIRVRKLYLLPYRHATRHFGNEGPGKNIYFLPTLIISSWGGGGAEVHPIWQFSDC